MDNLIQEVDAFLEGIGADGLSGGVDSDGPTGPSGGSPYSGDEEDQLQPPVSQVEDEEEIPLGDELINEAEGYMLGHPTDGTQTGKIQILVMDSTNLKVHAPQRILEQIEAYKFFEQFEYLLPKTPMLNASVMDSIARWWRNYAVPGDLLEIDCTNGFAQVINEETNNVYSLGCLGTIPSYPILTS